MNPIIRSLKFINILTCVGLVMKYLIMSFVVHHSTFNSFLLIQSVMQKKLLFMCLVRFLLDDFPSFYIRMELLLSWWKHFCYLLYLSFHKVPCPEYSLHAVVESNNLWYGWTESVGILFCRGHDGKYSSHGNSSTYMSPHIFMYFIKWINPSV